MQKRIRISVLLVAVVFLMAMTAMSLDTDPSATSNPLTQSMRLTFASDMLRPGQALPIIVRQSPEVTQVLDLFNNPVKFIFKAAALLSSPSILRCDAHFKARVLKIQTARWCAT